MKKTFCDLCEKEVMEGGVEKDVQNKFTTTVLGVEFAVWPEVEIEENELKMDLCAACYNNIVKSAILQK